MQDDVQLLNTSWLDATPILTAFPTSTDNYDALAGAAAGFNAGFEAGREYERQAQRDRAEHERCVDAMAGRGARGGEANPDGGDEPEFCAAAAAIEILLNSQDQHVDGTRIGPAVQDMTLLKEQVLSR